jgi:drug/metabolite transporter (DMT)-like permease
MRTQDWLLLVLLSTLWGTTFFFVAVALPYVPPLTLVLGRVGIAALVLVPVVWTLRYRLPGSVLEWWPFVVQAALNSVIPFSLMVYGQHHIASALAGVLNATTPLFTFIVARLFAGDTLTPNKTFGVPVGVLGVAVLMGPVAFGANAASLVGMLCVLGGALSYGLSALWMRRLRHIPPPVSAAAQVSCATLMLLPMAALTDGFRTLPLPPPAALLAVLGLAVLSTALAYIVFFRISASAGPGNVMLATLLIPVTATGLGVLVLGEGLTVHQIAGTLIIASGLIVIDGRLLVWWRKAAIACRAPVEVRPFH